jgi:MFS family permease
MQDRFSGLWRHADFMKLWSAETISLLGSAITQLALPLTAVSILNATPGEMGLLGATQFVPFLVLGLLAGVWVDRLRRRPILIVADVGRALVLITIPVAAILNRLSMGQLYLVTLIHGILTLFFDVAYQSYLPSLVNRENLVEGNSKLEISRAISAIAGPGIAGVLIKLLTAPITITLDSFSFLASAFFLWRIKQAEPKPKKRESGRNVWHEIYEGLGVVFGNRMLRSIAGCTSTSNLFGSIAFAVLILFLKRDLQFDEAVIGLVFGIGSVGGLVGAVVNQKLTKRFGVGPTIIGSALGFGLAGILVPLAIVGGVAAFALLAVSQFAGSVLNVTYNVNQVSLRQAITPDRLQGRMNASMRFLVWGTIPIGSLIGGFLGERIGLVNTLWVSALGTLLAFLWVYFSPVRSLQEQPSPVEDTPVGETAPAQP